MSALVERLLAASGDAQTLVERRAGYSVHQHAGLRWLYGGARSVQSVLCLDDPARPVLPATLQMLAALVLCPAPSAVLDLGLGGASIERYFARYEPATRLVAVEASGAVLELARRHFALPAALELLPGRAEHVVASLAQRFELVFVDLFVGERHAGCVADLTFLAALAGLLAPRGVVAFNLSPGSEAELLEVLLPLRRVLPTVWLAGVRDCGNVVLLASRAPAPAPRAANRRCARLRRLTGIDFRALYNGLCLLPVGAQAHRGDQ